MNEEIDLDELAPWLALCITVVGGWLRVLLLAQDGLWLDETFSIWLANHNLSEMLAWLVRIDQHPPLYYLLLHYWIALTGETPYDVRLLSALFGAATIPVIYLTGKRWSGALVGLVAALLLALSPFNLLFAQETRMYTLLSFNVAVAMYALSRLLTDARSAQPIGSQFRKYLRDWRTAAPVEPEAPEEFSYRNQARPQTGWRAWLLRHRWRSPQAIETDLAWVALIMFTAATLLTHNTAIFFLLAINLFVFGLMLFQKHQKPDEQPALQAPSLGNWFKAQIGICLLWSPWFSVFIRQARRVDQEFWIPKPDWETVIQTLKSLLNFATPTPRPAGPMTIIWLLYGLVLCLGLLHYRKQISRFLLLATLVAVPFVGELLVSLRRPIFLDRTLIWLTLPVLLVLAAGVAQLKFRPLIFVAVVSLSAINLFSASDYYRYFQKEDWSSAAGYVANFAEKGDLVLFNSNFVAIPFDYYFRDYEDLYSVQVVKQGIPADLFESGLLEPKMTENDLPGLITLLNGHDRVWLVYSHHWYTDPDGLIPQTLAAQMKLTRQRDFYGGKVQLYESP